MRPSLSCKIYFSYLILIYIYLSLVMILHQYFREFIALRICLLYYQKEKKNFFIKKSQKMFRNSIQYFFYSERMYLIFLYQFSFQYIKVLHKVIVWIFL